jgi:hypothetical protein
MSAVPDLDGQHVAVAGHDHVVSFVLDGAAKVVNAVVDARLDDGGSSAPQGWAFFSRSLGEVRGHDLQVDPAGTGCVRAFVIQDRALLTSEAIGTARALLGT